MGQGVPRPSYDAGSHRPPGPSLDHLRDECRELSTPRRTRPQAWTRAAADPRDNQGKRLIDAATIKTGTEEKCLRTSARKAIMTSLPAAASSPDCPRRSHPDCRATLRYVTEWECYTWTTLSRFSPHRFSMPNGMRQRCARPAGGRPQPITAVYGPGDRPVFGVLGWTAGSATTRTTCHPYQRRRGGTAIRAHDGAVSQRRAVSSSQNQV